MKKTMQEGEAIEDHSITADDLALYFQQPILATLKEWKALHSHKEKGKAFYVMQKFLVENGFPDKDFYMLALADFKHNKSSFERMFVLILEQFPDFSVVNFALDLGTEMEEDSQITSDELRNFFELAVKKVGIDLMTGIEIWNKYQEYELNEFQDFLEMNSSSIDNEELQSRKERLIKLFHRQLSLPLIGNDTTLSKLSVILEEFCDEKDVDIIQPQILEVKIRESSKRTKDRQQFEINLFTNSEKYRKNDISIPDKYAAWKSYINFEISEEQYLRVERLYERLLIEFYDDYVSASSPEIQQYILKFYHLMWVECLDFKFHKLKNYPNVVSFCKIGLRIFKYSFYLREFLLLSLEMQTRGETFKNRLQLIKTEFEYGISAGFETVVDYYSYYFSYCNCVRRVVDNFFAQKILDVGSTSIVSIPFLAEDVRHLADELRLAISQMEQFMIEYAANWFQGWDKFALYQAEMLATRITPLEAFLSMSTNENLLLTFPPPPTMTEFINIIKGVSTSANETSSFQQKFSGWDNYVKSCPHSYYVYQEYCKYLLTRRNYAQIRSLFKKIGNKRSKLDVSELNVIKDWFTFEENYCQDIKTLLFVSEKLLPLEIQSLIVEMSAGPIEKQAATCQTTADNQQKQEEQHSQSNPRKRKQENDAVDEKGSKKKKVIFSDADELCAESVMPVQPPANSLSTTKVQQENSTPMEISSTSIQTSIIRFKNIPFTSKLPEISAFFSQFVPFQKLEMIYSKSGVFRGMVNIEYASIDHIRDLLSHSTQFTLLGRPLEYELNVPALNNFDPALFTTIFINHLPSETKESELMEFFISCGPIQRIHLAIDKKTSQLKGSALIQFQTVESRNQALQMNKQNFKGNEITVWPSKFTINQTSPDENKKLAVTENGKSAEEGKVNPLPEVVVKEKKSTEVKVTQFRPRGVMKPKLQL